MRLFWLFGLVTFLLAWGVELVFIFIPALKFFSPGWLLLLVLALGGMGMTNLAQTLGFFWGLCLDIFGMSLFGTHGLLFSIFGYLAGYFSKQLNTEKLITQETLSFVITLGYGIGLYGVELIFRSFPRQVDYMEVAAVLVVNAAIAPVVFGAARRWSEMWGHPGRSGVFHG